MGIEFTDAYVKRLRDECARYRTRCKVAESQLARYQGFMDVLPEAMVGALEKRQTKPVGAEP